MLKSPYSRQCPRQISSLSFALRPGISSLRGGSFAAMEISNESDISATYFFENFMFRDKELRIKQNTCVGHNAVIWDAARVLAKYFENTSVDWTGKKVTVTELPERTELLKENVELNVPGKQVTVRDCVWGEVGTTTAWGKVEDFGNDWDFITGSDLIYSDDSTPALIQTLMRCCTSKTEIVLSLELRREKDLDFFAQIGKLGFKFNRVEKKDLHPVYQADEIAVFRIWRPA